MKRIYALNGFKLVISGCILRIIFSAGEYFFYDGLKYSIVLLLELAAVILVIVGIFKLRPNDIRFGKAKNDAIVAAITGVASLLLVLLGAGGTRWVPGGGESGQAGATAGAGIAMFLLIVGGIAVLVCAFNLIYGCQDIASRQGNPEFASKCKRAWIVYICGLILSSLIEQLPEMWESPGAFENAALIVAAAVETIASVWVLLIFYKTYKRYNGQEIKELEDESEGLPEDPRGSEQQRG